MNININELRGLIRTGEHLWENQDNFKGFDIFRQNAPLELKSDTDLCEQWIYSVKLFINDLDIKTQTLIHNKLISMENHDISGYKSVMGFLHSLYNRYTPGNTRLPVHTGSQQVFIVHGHDNDMIESIKNIICELNLSPLVLREQPDKGKTIIEKLEEHLGNCKCAIVLYTPCDKGAKHDSDDYKPRARQNVVYEHGLLQGYLGRPRIIVVQKDDTELMGDCQGIIVVKTSETDWKEHIKREIEAIDKM